MEKLFHFDCEQEVYRADACVISCFDFRFDTQLRKFLKRRGVAIYDHIKIPGSVKAIADPACDSDRDFVLTMLRTSLRLHRPTRLLLFGHNDCGAYPGAPPSIVTADLAKAVEYFTQAEPALQIEAFFCDFDGIYSYASASTTSCLAARSPG
jgi:hypothetical protein